MDSMLSHIPSWPGTAALTDALRDPKGLFVMLAVVMLVLYGLSVGRTRALISLLSIYVAYMLVVLFPFLPWVVERLPEQSRPLGAGALFIVLYALTFIILSQSMLRSRLALGEISLWQVLVISVVQIGLLASICVSLVPVDKGEQLIGPMYRWLGGSRVLWAWAVIALLMMPFMRPHRRRN